MSSKNTNFFIKIGEASLDLFRDCIDLLGFVGEASSALAKAICKPHKVRWRETMYYMDMCGSDALPIVALICFLMGLILAFQSAIQLERFGAVIMVPGLVGCSIVKELGPLMVAMIATGRAGGAFAAEIGTMKVNEEIDAMITMGFVPSRFIVVPKIIAMFVVMPILTIFGDLTGMLGGMTVGVFRLDIPIQTYYAETVKIMTPMYLTEGMVKSAVFALLIAGVGCMRGYQSSSDAQGVGRSATSAVVSGIFLVVIADLVFTMLFNT